MANTADPMVLLIEEVKRIGVEVERQSTLLQQQHQGEVKDIEVDENDDEIMNQNKELVTWAAILPGERLQTSTDEGSLLSSLFREPPPLD